MTETIRDEADHLARLADGAAAYSTNREKIRDIIVSVPSLIYPTLAGEVGVTNKRYPYGDVRRYGAAVGGAAATNTTSLQAALTANTGPITFPDGNFNINDALLPIDDNEIILRPGTQITQTVADKNIFRVVQKDNVWIHCNGAVLYGEGTWSSSWTGNTGHEDRGIQFLGCTNSGTTYPRVRNCGHAGVVVRGGTNITIDHPTVEGTHALSTPLVQNNNFQLGIYVAYDATYGNYDGIKVIEPTVFNTNQGILCTQDAQQAGSLQLTSPRFYDIIGQHGAYIAASNVTMSSPHISDCGLNGFKVFSGTANEVIDNVIVSDFNISDCPNGTAANLETSGTGYLVNCHANGVATGCARGAGIVGDVRSSSVKIVSDTLSQYSFYMANGGSAGASNCDFEVVSRSTQLQGALITSSLSANNRLRMKGFRSGLAGTLSTSSMIEVTSCTSMTIESPECIDDGSTMQYGIIVQTGGNVKITGTPVIKGYVTNGVRVVLGGLTEWLASPGEFTALTTAFANTGDGVLPSSPLGIGRQTTSASNLVIYSLTLADESAYHLSVRLVGKLSGSAQRGSFVAHALASRDAAGSAVLDETLTLATLNSASFLGVFSFDVSGSQIRVLVNSGAAATTTDWTARIVVVRQL